ncbi:MAG TPA: deoxyribonuclease HsdR [Flavobacteriales bacterium]|nr:deoxyribonuclease HsdR [Flavobacteriales bacterium]HRE74279.1 trypsin-like peptidase domain-containing protein [Flavobacteriales bacterium]HRJ39131.1 trypsin-like peptidase domain-containing protein [Flavobacteriales bacterium]
MNAKFFAGTLLTGFAGGMISFTAMEYFTDHKSETIIVEHRETKSVPTSLTNQRPDIAPVLPVDFTYAAEQTVNSVVHIRTEVPAPRNAYVDPLYQYFHGPSPRNNGFAEAAGSGVLLTADGYIVTNNHVIENARKISVTMNNNQTYTAKLVGADPGTDIAVIRIEGKDLPAIEVGNSDDVKIGEWVLAVGNPFNLTSTVTAGIVSAKARNINILQGDPSQEVYPVESFIQTDAAVNPGNSGGALVNAKGQLIGINTAIASNTGSYSGYSFAVPINLVHKVTSDLIRFGVVQRGFLGVNIRNIDQQLATSLKLDRMNGVYVGGIVSGGAGEEAGISEGDIIVSVAGKDVSNVPELQEQVARYRPGDKIQIGVIRSRKEMLIPVTLRNSKNTTEMVKKEELNLTTALGADFAEPSPLEKQRLRIKGGAKVTDLRNGKLRSAGLKPGFIITRIDDVVVENPDHMMKVLKEKQGGVLVEGMYPNGARGYFALGL